MQAGRDEQESKTIAKVIPDDLRSVAACECYGCNRPSYWTKQCDFMGLYMIRECELHTTYICRLCHSRDINNMIVGKFTNREIDETDRRFLRDHYIRIHLLERWDNLYVIAHSNEYYVCGHGGSCSSIRITNLFGHPDYIAAIRPEFHILQQFRLSAIEVNLGGMVDIHKVLSSKLFSCVICGDIYESFPSAEIIDRHMKLHTNVTFNT